MIKLIKFFSNLGKKDDVPPELQDYGWTTSNPRIGGNILNNLFYQIFSYLNIFKNQTFLNWDDTEEYFSSVYKRELRIYGDKLYVAKLPSNADGVSPKKPSLEPSYWDIILDLSNVIYKNGGSISIGENVLNKEYGLSLRNVGIGAYCLEDIIDGAGNVGIGSFSLGDNISGDNNTAVGKSSLRKNTASYNTAVGAYSLLENTIGINNTAVGQFANNTNISGNSNTSVGSSALSSSTSSDNTAIGDGSLYESETGSRNTAIGKWSLRFNQVSGSNISYSNCSGLGCDTKVSGDNQVQLGDSLTTTYCYGAIQNRSDKRDKTDIRDTVLGLDFVNKIRVVDFKWDMRDDYFKEVNIPNPKYDKKDKNSQKTIRTLEKIPKDGSKSRGRFHHGVIAQDIQKIIKDTGVDFGGFQDHSISGGKDVLSIGYEEFIPPIMKSIQELTSMVQTLQAEVTQLKQAKVV